MDISLSTLNIVFLLFRYILCLWPLWGYVHPDQFLQSAEVMAGSFLGYNVTYTWEWKGEYPIRNVFFPMMTSGVPFMMLKMLNNVLGVSVSAYAILVLPRLLNTALLSLGDVILSQILELLYPFNKARRQLVIFLWRSSHIALVFFSFNFSNSMETLTFLFLLYLLTLFKHQRDTNGNMNSTWKNYLNLGVILSLGIFSRPTFICFCFYPFAAILTSKKQGNIEDTSNCGIKKYPIFSLLFGFLLTSVSLVILDSMFHFGSRWKILLTPLAFLGYNTRTSNLEKHGLHPRYLHFVCNLPILFGPAYFVFLATSICSFSSKVSQWFSSKKDVAGQESDRYSIQRHDNLLPHFTLSVFLSTALISIVPHQEPRFLLPVIGPLLIVVGSAVYKSHVQLQKLFVIVWLIFNASMLILFGVLHQGGIVPCLLHLNKLVHSSNPTRITNPINYHLIFWKTYPAPSFLLQIHNEKGSQSHVTVHNLAGASRSALQDTLNKIWQTKEIIDGQRNEKVYLAMPSTVWNRYKFCEPIKYFWPHLTLEDPPWENSMTMSSYSNVTQIMETYMSLILCEAKRTDRKLF